MMLQRKYVEKPWGQRRLPPPFSDMVAADMTDRQIGEIWYESGQDRLPLMLKYLFTSEKLSIQVHPSDAQAQRMGLSGGKEECWLVLDAQPGATLGIGLTAPADTEELRAAALSGAIEQMIDWKPVSRGDFFYIPAGTIHAIGAGVTLVEMQQNADITYRLYDYGRPRELHLDAGLAVARGEIYDMAHHARVDFAADAILVDSPLFRMDLRGADPIAFDGRGPYLVAPLAGSVLCGQERAMAGDCMAVADLALLTPSDDARLLIARRHS